MVLVAAVATAAVLLGAVGLRQLSSTDHAAHPAQKPVSPAPGKVLPLRTGVFGTEKMRPPIGGFGESGDGSEWLNLGSPDLPGFLAAQTRAIPLPSNQRWDPIQRRLSLPGKRMQSTFVSANLVRYALCVWGGPYDAHPDPSARWQIERLSSWKFTYRDPATGKAVTMTSAFVDKPIGRAEIRAYVRSNCGAAWRLAGAVR